MGFEAWQIALICIEAAALAALTAVLAAARAKAGKIGILITKLPRNAAVFAVCIAVAAAAAVFSLLNVQKAAKVSAYIRSLETRGTAAFEDRYGITLTDNEPETLRLLLTEEQKAAEKQANEYKATAVCGGLFALLWGYVLLISGVRITEDGLMTFIDFKPRETRAENERGEICFYTDKKPDKPVVRFPAVRENLKLFDKFIIREEKTAPPLDEPSDEPSDDEPSDKPSDKLSDAPSAEPEKTAQSVDGEETE